MKKIQYAILILLLIFLVNTATAPANNYVPLTLGPGDEIAQTLSFSGAYGRLFATADVSGSAALWVTPRRIDFGAIDPGEIIERDYTINVPRSQKPGYYEVTWKFSCKYTDGSACSSASNVVLQITVKAEPVPTSSGAEYEYLTIKPGEETSKYLSFSARSDQYGLSAWADASGNAASWVTPRRIDFGVIAAGDSIDKYYTLKVPEYQRPGNYELIWTWGCEYKSGKSCQPLTSGYSYKITVLETRGIQEYTPESTDSDIALGIFILIFVLVLFIVGLYILVWVVKDANKRGSSGTLWGILVLVSGIIGLILYFIFRPKGNFVSCNYCGKGKLETLIQCPHCKKSPAPAFGPAPAPMAVQLPVTPVRPEAAIDDLKKQKEKLSRIKELLEKLDERLAQGDITEGRYKELSEQYQDESEKLKNMITEKELLKEVGL
ncbi:MAG: hypothetical protein PHH85_13850 [Candidatus Methanoperedens sp.]|nr:hypothetical protein [Candidatus Methanoperedens sp.]